MWRRADRRGSHRPGFRLNGMAAYWACPV